MARLEWDLAGEHYFEHGVDHGVLFKSAEKGGYENGVVWNGLTTVTETPTGGEPTDVYADNIKYLSLMSAETFEATIEAMMSPPEFDECDGTAEVVPGITIRQQPRKSFAFAYRSYIGNDVNDRIGYRINIMYGAKASPSERSRDTINDSPDASPLSWSVNTTPVNVTGHEATSFLSISSIDTPADKLKLIEDKLYGTESTEPKLMMPDEIFALFDSSNNEEAVSSTQAYSAKQERVTNKSDI